MPVAPLVRPPRLRTLEHTHHRVTWLELFFDLVFVAAVAQVAAPLESDYTVAGLGRFTLLFLLIWWAWVGHATFATRFDTDDLVQRSLTLLQMFVVAVMAANARDALDSRSSAGFAAAYAVLRLILAGQYLRLWRLPEARPLAWHYLPGLVSAATLWLISAALPVPQRYWIWAVAMAIDVTTPVLAERRGCLSAPIDPAHLPERFGLFTIILLGESVVAVMYGIESHDEWSATAALSALGGLALAMTVWWGYFDGAEGAAERPIRTDADARRFLVWNYAHVPLFLGIAVAGVGVRHVITLATSHPLHRPEGILLGFAFALVLMALALIGACRSEDARQVTRRGPGGGLALGLAAVFAGTSVEHLPAPLLIGGFVVLGILQTAGDRRARVPAPAEGAPTAA